MTACHRAQLAGNAKTDRPLCAPHRPVSGENMANSPSTTTRRPLARNGTAPACATTSAGVVSAALRGHGVERRHLRVAQPFPERIYGAFTRIVVLPIVDLQHDISLLFSCCRTARVSVQYAAIPMTASPSSLQERYDIIAALPGTSLYSVYSAIERESGDAVEIREPRVRALEEHSDARAVSLAHGAASGCPSCASLQIAGNPPGRRDILDGV